jgi:hypothetical protein
MAWHLCFIFFKRIMDTSLSGLTLFVLGGKKKAQVPERTALWGAIKSERQRAPIPQYKTSIRQQRKFLSASNRRAENLSVFIFF